MLNNLKMLLVSLSVIDCASY